MTRTIPIIVSYKQTKCQFIKRLSPIPATIMNSRGTVQVEVMGHQGTALVATKCHKDTALVAIMYLKGTSLTFKQ